MDSNKIKEIPHDICNLKSLVKLQLRNNIIKVVPVFLQKLTRLKNFFIYGCPIETLEAP